MNRFALSVLRDDLFKLNSSTDCSGVNYAADRGGQVRNKSPVESYAERIESLRRKILYLEGKVIPVEDLISDLVLGKVSSKNKDLIMLKILYFHLWFDEPISKLMLDLNLSRRTMINHKRKLIQNAYNYIRDYGYTKRLK